MHRSARAVVITAAVVLALVTAGATAAPALVVRGDARAWSEIAAALTKFSRLKSYRAEGNMSGGGSMSMEVVNPDRFRTRMEAGGVTIETVVVGKETRFRQGNAPWMCTGQAPTVPTTNPERFTGEVTAAKGPAATIDRVATQSYTYTWKSGGQTSNFRLYVATGNGLPKRMELLDEKGAVQMTFDYYDYDAAITIALPSCS